MSADDTTKAFPPYVAFEPLVTFTGQLSKTVVPTVIDKGLMTSMSGATQSHLMSAMRTLGLLDADNASTQALHDLVKAHGTPEWPEALRRVIDGYYSTIMGDVDITTATAKQVRDRFKEAGVDGSMADRAIRFFIKAMEEAKMEFSPHIKVRKKSPRKSSRTPKANSDSSKGSGESLDPEQSQRNPPPKDPPVEKGMIKFPLYFKRENGPVAGVIIVPESLTQADIAVVDAMIVAIKAFAGEG